MRWLAARRAVLSDSTSLTSSTEHARPKATRRNITPRKTTPRKSRGIADLGRRFDQAVAALNRFDLGWRGTYPFSVAEDARREHDRERLEAAVRHQIRTIRDLIATDLETLRLKARVVYWCNADFDHLDSGYTDSIVTKSILLDLLNVDASAA